MPAAVPSPDQAQTPRGQLPGRADSITSLHLPQAMGRPHQAALAWAGVAIIGLGVFGFRLIPVAEGDRAIFEAVGDGLRTGQRLYAEVYDNKEPLFFYAVALQRWLGAFGGWLFEAACLALAGWSLAGLHRWLAGGEPERRGEWLSGVLGALLLSGGFWGAGQPQLPASALLLLSVLLICRGRPAGAGIATAAMAGFKLISLPVGVAMATVLLPPPQRARSLLRFCAAAALAGALLVLVLHGRGELAAYGQTLANNLLYSQGLLIQPGSVLQVTASHGRTLFFSGKNNALMLLALVTAAAILLKSARDPSPRRARLARAGLAGLVCAAAITTGTGLWAGHLQLLYPTQCLALVLLVQGWQPQIRWQKAMRLPSLLLITAFLSGTLDLAPTYWLRPHQIADRVARLQQRSPEEIALRRSFPERVPNFARLGGNGGRIPVGLDGSRLTCADFHQYGFYGEERLAGILGCISRSPVVLVSADFTPWDGVPTWLPAEAQGAVIQQRWNRFVAGAEERLAAGFHCRRGASGARVCLAKGPR